MSIGADVTAALPGMRAAAESLMVDSVRVERPGLPVTDPETGDVTTPSVVVYVGPGKVQSTLPQAAHPVAGEHQFTVQQASVHVPVSAGPVMVGDLVVPVAVVHDAALVGRVFRVKELLHKSFATAQRLSVEEVVA